jgi:hypothetical protein
MSLGVVAVQNVPGLRRAKQACSNSSSRGMVQPVAVQVSLLVVVGAP